MPKLETIKLTKDAGSGKVLTSDASGNATWQMPSTGDAGVWSGGNASTNFTGQPLIRSGGAS